MKVLVIGDIHGQDAWEEIAKKALTEFQKIIFVGDYVDSFTIKPSVIKYNLENIIKFKKEYPDDVTLLLGNHDWAYIYDEQAISGFNWQVWQDYKKVFNDNIDLFDIAWGYTNPKTKKYTLATHAGLTYGFYKGNIYPSLQDEQSALYKIIEGNLDTPLHEILNYLKGKSILWKVGAYRGGSGTPGPLWADYLEFLQDPYPGINQIFGHTAAGTVTVSTINGDLIAKVDGWYNKKLSHLSLDI